MAVAVGKSPKSTTKPKKIPAKLVAMRVSSLYLAGPVRFELTMGFPTPVFKTGAFNRSATDPGSNSGEILSVKD